MLYPDGDWYGELSPDDAEAIADALVDGKRFDAKLADAPGDDGDR